MLWRLFQEERMYELKNTFFTSAFMKSIHVKLTYGDGYLSNEGVEVRVFEVDRQNVFGEECGVVYDEADSIGAPADDVGEGLILSGGGGYLKNFVGFEEEG